MFTIQNLPLVLAGCVVLAIPSSASAQLGRQQGLIDPHVAADSVVAKLPHMSAALTEKLRVARPILSLVTLDSILGANGLTKPQRTELFGKMIVHVDANRGTDAELMLIPGVDATKLRAVKAGRPWKSFTTFQTELAKSMPAAEVARIEQYLFIPIDLNSSANKEVDPAFDAIVDTFAGIGVGTSRWKREFKEYRPWTSQEQFDREIGKYVRNNPTEVKRLWRYVIINK